MCELMRYEPLLLLPPPPPGGRIGGFKKGKERERRGGKGDSEQGRTRTEQDSFICLHGGLDTRSMYEKLTMLNLQSGSNWSGPNNWYHDPTSVQTQHSTGERCSMALVAVAPTCSSLAA